MPVAYLIAYDIVEDDLRSDVADICLKNGFVRIQYSVFFGAVTRSKAESTLMEIKEKIAGKDAQILMLEICEKCRKKKKIVIEQATKNKKESKKQEKNNLKEEKEKKKEKEKEEKEKLEEKKRQNTKEEKANKKRQNEKMKKRREARMALEKIEMIEKKGVIII